MTPSPASRPEDTVRPVPTWELRSAKIQPWHLDRLAMVYVRQSTAQQVLDHQESTRLQYGLRARASELGWAAERIVVIDDDLGKSGATAEGRVGFQRLVSEVSLDHVGIILGVEMSRLARSGKDWYQLLELCALFRTLLADSDGVYDPAHYNDRLLLGLKGTLSEAELHVLKQRMHEGKLNKARRGELALRLPIGYVRRSSGEAAFDPDAQVQEVVRLVFCKFEELGTLNAVLRYLVTHDIQLGVRNRRELEWHRPNRMILQNLLKNPVYAGAYAYGRRQVDPRKKRAGRPSTGRVVMDPQDWVVLQRDHHPAYISWDQYEANLARLRANRSRAEAIGAARSGAALLAGLVVCGRCGHRMSVAYGEDRYLYRCNRLMTDYGGALCQEVAGRALDAFLSQQVLKALEPAALELSLEAAQHVERERADLDRLWQQRLERSRYEAERAARQYHLCEPENRLVARQLEHAWEEKLAAQQRLEEDYHRFLRTQPRGLTAHEREAIRRLAEDVPALWHAPTTTAADRKEIIRQVVERVVVTGVGTSERVHVAIIWAGGVRTEGECRRPVARLEQLSYYPQLCARVRALAGEGLRAREIARCLNAEGFRPPKRHEQFGPQGVQDLLHRLGVPKQRSRSKSREGLGEHEWWLPNLAQALGMPTVTLYLWAYRGWLRARRQEQPPRRWIIWADRQEMEQLRRRYQRPAGYYTRQRWVASASATDSV